jgi:hypothetical protein
MRKKSKPQVTFQSYNPYEARYPGLRVVSRQTLHLIKMLRSEGYKVSVEPENGTKLFYLAEKGIREFLADPIIALVVGVSLSFLVNLLSSWVYDFLKRKPENDDEVNMVLESDENGRKARYNYRGEPISDERFQALLSSVNDRAQQYSESLKLQPPDPSRPYPIYLEHTGQIVGWAERVVKDDTGMKIEGVKILDEQTHLRIQYDDLTGFSIGGIIRKSTCFICKRDYVECNHITGKQYNGKECVVRIDDILLADFSVVKKPVQPLAKLKKVYKKKAG